MNDHDLAARLRAEIGVEPKPDPSIWRAIELRAAAGDSKKAVDWKWQVWAVAAGIAVLVAFAAALQPWQTDRVVVEDDSNAPAVTVPENSVVGDSPSSPLPGCDIAQPAPEDVSVPEDLALSAIQDVPIASDSPPSSMVLIEVGQSVGSAVTVGVFWYGAQTPGPLVPEGGAVQSRDDVEQGDMHSVAVSGKDGAVALTLASRELSADQLSDLAESAAVAEDGRVMIGGTPATSIAELSPSDLLGEGSTPVSYQRYGYLMSFTDDATGSAEASQRAVAIAETCVTGGDSNRLTALTWWFGEDAVVDRSADEVTFQFDAADGSGLQRLHVAERNDVVTTVAIFGLTGSEAEAVLAGHSASTSVNSLEPSTTTLPVPTNESNVVDGTTAVPSTETAVSSPSATDALGTAEPAVSPAGASEVQRNVTPSEPPAQTVSAGRVAWDDVPLPQFDPVPTSVERVKVDGTHVVITFAGDIPFRPSAPCSKAYTVRVDELADRVIVRIEGWMPDFGAPPPGCQRASVVRSVEFELAAPLGTRELVAG